MRNVVLTALLIITPLLAHADEAEIPRSTIYQELLRAQDLDLAPVPMGNLLHELRISGAFTPVCSNAHKECCCDCTGYAGANDPMGAIMELCTPGECSGTEDGGECRFTIQDGDFTDAYIGTLSNCRTVVVCNN